METIHAIEVNCVSPKIADQMAMNVISMFNSDWGVGITSYASANGQSDHKAFAYFSIAFRQSVKLSGILNAAEVLPPEAQLYYTTEVLRKIKQVIC